MYSMNAMHLMMCTALVESKLTHVKQIPDGPALGFMQVEWSTYKDCVRYLKDEPGLSNKILTHLDRVTFPAYPHVVMADITLNVLIARVKYWMQPEPLPSYKDVERLALYYETYYNGNPEVDKTPEFIVHAKNVGGWITPTPGTDGLI